jgi:hypothetical protein
MQGSHESNDLQSPLKNKIIYTNQGWGIAEAIKRNPAVGASSNLTTSKNVEKKRLQTKARSPCP